MALGFVLLALIGGCTPMPVSGLRCSSDRECASGRACVDGSCVVRIHIDRDAGAWDAATPDDAGGADAGGADAGGADAGGADAGGADAGGVDGGAFDGGAVDAGGADAGGADAGALDAGHEPAQCGDDVLDLDEGCDDGNVDDRDGCSRACRVWWDEDFQLRARVDLANPFGPLDDVPVLVVLPDSLAEDDPFGDTLCFVADDHATALPFEVDHVDEAAGEALVWVRVPRLESGGGVIWLYAGYSGAADAPCGVNPSDTWSEYVAVWHLDDDLGDATGGGATLTNQGTTLAAGRVGGARQCAETSRSLSASVATSPHLRGDLTVEAWVRLESLDNLGNQIATMTDIGANYEAPALNVLYSLRVGSTSGLVSYWEYDDGIDHAFTTGQVNDLSIGAWHHLAITRRSATKQLKFYVDGREVAGRTYVRDPTDGALSRLFLCANPNPNFADHGLPGRLDEVRIADDVKSPDWLEMSVLSATRGVATVGPPSAE